MDIIQFKPDWVFRPESKLVSDSRTNATDPSIPVVIAEDDPVSRKLVVAVVEAAGFRTIVTEDGEEAMSVLRAQTRPCVAVIDWMMPGMDGQEICRRMQESDRDVYVIMLTARDDKDDTARCLDSGANDYLVKPFNQRELIARIHTGVRALTAQAVSRERVKDLEESALYNTAPKLQMPL